MPATAWAFLWHVLMTLPPRIRLCLLGLNLMTAIVVSTNIVMMYGFKLLVDNLQTADPQDPWHALLRPFLFLAVCCTVHTVLYRLRSVFDIYSMPQTQNALREKLFDYMLEHSHDYFHSRFSGDLVNKIGNVNRAWFNILWERIQHGFIFSGFAVAAASVVMWRVDTAIVFILWGVVLALVVCTMICGPYISRASASLADRESDIAAQLTDTLTNVSSVKNYTGIPHEFSLLRGIQGRYLRDYRKLGWLNMLFWGLFDIGVTALLLGLIWRLVAQWNTGAMTLGDVVMCISIAWDLWWRLSFLSWNLLELAGDRGRLQSALDEILPAHEITDAPAAQNLRVTEGAIVFDDVRFVHKSGHKVFDGLRLSLKPAEKVGLVGLSGAGKTTLCQLLLRNYDLQGGRILIDGQDIAKVKQASLRQAIAVIPQDPSLFHRSLKENILYGMPGAGAEKVIAAASAAQAHGFIESLPQGYDTTVGERGVKLSGGQRQRIAIARAILKDAHVLVLDEATSALDSQTERQIQAALVTAMKGRTTLVIAHRLSTLAHLDRLVVLKEGRVAEEGTLSELLALNGHFAELWRCQADGFLPEKM